MHIDKMLLDINKYSRPGKKRNKTTKIAWHYVGNPNSSAKANRNYFNNAPKHKTSASSHYIVGLDGEIIQCVPDDEIAYTTNDANSYSIGIEVCHPDSTGKFKEVTEKALIELTAMICNKYKLSSKDIIRHYDVTKKKCPLYYVNNINAYENARKEVQKLIDNNSSAGGSTSNTKIKDGDYTNIKAKVVNVKSNDVLNVRYDRGSKYKDIGDLKPGSIVTCQFCLDGWMSINGFKGNKGLGYVNASYLELI